jgi:hypothetical protein
MCSNLNVESIAGRSRSCRASRARTRKYNLYLRKLCKLATVYAKLTKAKEYEDLVSDNMYWQVTSFPLMRSPNSIDFIIGD